MKKALLWIFLLLGIVLVSYKVYLHCEERWGYKTIRLKSLSRINERSIVFVGDSHIAQFPLTEWFRNTNVLNNGISGNQTKNVLYRIGMVAEHKPRSIFLQVGINDLLQTGFTSADTVLIDNYKKIIDLSRKVSPATKLFINSVMPIGNGYAGQHNDSITKCILHVNKVLKKLAIENDCVYIDVFKALETDNHLPFYFTVDGLHLNRLGYHRWFGLLKQYVTR